MQITFPRVSRRSRQLACAILLAGTVAATVILAHPAWETFLLRQPSTCLLKIFAGIPCLACRGTRAALALSHGHLGRALAFNPLGTLFLLGLAAYLASLSLTGKSIEAKLSRAEWTVLWVVFALALAGNWIYVISQGG